MPRGAEAQSSAPVSAFNAMQNSWSPLSTGRRTMVKAFPPLTEKELKAISNGTFQTCRGGSSDQFVRMVSVEMPSWFGPRYCGQSPAQSVAAVRAANHQRHASRIRRQFVRSRLFMFLARPTNRNTAEGKPRNAKPRYVHHWQITVIRALRRVKLSRRRAVGQLNSSK